MVCSHVSVWVFPVRWKLRSERSCCRADLELMGIRSSELLSCDGMRWSVDHHVWAAGCDQGPLTAANEAADKIHPISSEHSAHIRLHFDWKFSEVWLFSFFMTSWGQRCRFTSCLQINSIVWELLHAGISSWQTAELYVVWTDSRGDLLMDPVQNPLQVLGLCRSRLSSEHFVLQHRS